MKKLIVTIARGNENFGAWIDEIPGIYGQGDTVEDAQNELKEGLALYVKHNKEVPAVLSSDFEYEYVYDVPSFLSYYSKIFSKPALQHITGINQKQLFHYASGRSKPKTQTVRKINNSFRRFSSELNKVSFAC